MVSCRLSQGSSAIRNLHTGWESETSGERTVQAVQGSRLGRFVSTNKMGAKTWSKCEEKPDGNEAKPALWKFKDRYG